MRKKKTNECEYGLRKWGQKSKQIHKIHQDCCYNQHDLEYLTIEMLFFSVTVACIFGSSANGYCAEYEVC